MNKEEKRQAQNATIYRIEKAFGKVEGVYKISKRVMDIPLEHYHVTVKEVPLKGGEPKKPPLNLWCDCPGFRGQKFAHIEHKHVRMALHYQANGEPEWADFKLFGTGQKTEMVFIGDSNE